MDGQEKLQNWMGWIYWLKHWLRNLRTGNFFLALEMVHLRDFEGFQLRASFDYL